MTELEQKLTSDNSFLRNEVNWLTLQIVELSNILKLPRPPVVETTEDRGKTMADLTNHARVIMSQIENKNIVIPQSNPILPKKKEKRKWFQFWK